MIRRDVDMILILLFGAGTGLLAFTLTAAGGDTAEVPSIEPSSAEAAAVETPANPPQWWTPVEELSYPVLKSDFCQEAGVVVGENLTVNMSMCTNDAGFRGRHYAPDPSNGTYRIITLGDSVTFGLGVGNNQTWPAHLEKHLNRGRNDSSSPQFQVLNMAGPSWTTKEEVKFFAWKGVDYHPDLVILQFMDNDAINRSRVDQLKTRYMESLLEDGVDEQTARIRAAKRAIEAEREERRALPIEEELRTVDPWFTQLENLSERHGFEVVVMYYGTNFWERYRPSIRERASRYGWYFHVSDLDNRPEWDADRDAFTRDTFYLTSSGYRKIASMLHTYLLENGIVGGRSS